MRQGRFGLGYILCLADDITLGIIYIKETRGKESCC